MNRKDFLKSILVGAAIAPKDEPKNADVIKTVRLHDAEKLHLEDLYPIDRNLPLRDGSYLTDGEEKYYIWHDGKWNDYWEVKGHLHTT